MLPESTLRVVKIFLRNFFAPACDLDLPSIYLFYQGKISTIEQGGKGVPDAKYDWDTWMNGEQHSITKDIDFTCTVTTMVQMLHRRAKSVGRVVNTRTLGDMVIFVFEGKTEERNSTT